MVRVGYVQHQGSFYTAIHESGSVFLKVMYQTMVLSSNWLGGQILNLIIRVRTSVALQHMQTSHKDNGIKPRCIRSSRIEINSKKFGECDESVQ